MNGSPLGTLMPAGSWSPWTSIGYVTHTNSGHPVTLVASAVSREKHLTSQHQNVFVASIRTASCVKNNCIVPWFLH